MLNSSVVRSQLASVSMLLVLATTPGRDGSSQTEPPTLTGRWELSFMLLSQSHRLQFDAQASGEGVFLSLDPVSNPGHPPAPTRGMWVLNGQSPAIYYFVIAGDVEFPISEGGREKGRIELSASSDLTLPITSLRGWGQFHSSNSPNDGRGSQDPIFDFTATRVEKLIVQLVSPVSTRKLRRGKDVKIEWEVQSAFPLASQKILVSVDGGDSFVEIAPSLGGEARSFTWTLPETLPKTKRALIKIVATDINGASAEGMSARTLRIK